MSTPPINGMFVFTTAVGTGVTTGNAYSTNPDGTVNVAGTVIGVAQSGQSLASLSTIGSETTFAVKVVPGVGAGLAAGGAAIELAEYH